MTFFLGFLAVLHYAAVVPLAAYVVAAVPLAALYVAVVVVEKFSYFISPLRFQLLPMKKKILDRRQ